MTPAGQALKEAVAKEDAAVDKAVAFINGVPAAMQAAVAAAQADDDALAKEITDDVTAHAKTITDALTPPAA